MVTTPLLQDFADFLRLLNSHGVEYLLIGGYAVGIHGYPRGTADLDVWVSTSRANAIAIVDALKEFGFDMPELSPALFQQPDKEVRMGVPPIRIDVLTSIAGVAFDECYRRRDTVAVGELHIPVLSLPDLKTNKLATGRTEDKADREHLP